MLQVDSLHGCLAKTVKIAKMCVSVRQEDQEELSPSPTEDPWPKKFPEPLSWRSDEEDEDSDFGEEQRDRYLKVLSSHTHLTLTDITPCNIQNILHQTLCCHTLCFTASR